MKAPLKELINADIDDLKSPSNRLLVRMLLFSIITIFTFYDIGAYKRLEDCKEEGILLRQENNRLSGQVEKRQNIIDSMVMIVVKQQDSKTNIIREMTEWQDSVKQILKQR